LLKVALDWFIFEHRVMGEMEDLGNQRMEKHLLARQHAVKKGGVCS